MLEWTALAGVSGGLLCVVISATVYLISRIHDVDEQSAARIKHVEQKAVEFVDKAIIHERNNNDRVYAVRTDLSRIEAKLDALIEWAGRVNGAK